MHVTYMLQFIMKNGTTITSIGVYPILEMRDLGIDPRQFSGTANTPRHQPHHSPSS